MILSDVSVKRPIFATVISLLLVAFGIISFSDLPLREYPDTDPPIVSVDTNYPGASAAIVETRVTQILEDRIAGIEGIKTIESSSRDGVSTVTIEFKLSRDIDAAANDVRDRVSRVLDNLPEEADPPEISKVDSNTRPIMWLNLQSETLDVLQLTDFAERELVDRLSVIDGVSGVRIGGQQRYAMRIDLDRTALAARNLTINDVEEALRRENVELPAGKLESTDREFQVRLDRSYLTAEDFTNLVIRRGDDGYLLRLGEVATVARAGQLEKSVFRGNGFPMIGLGIVRQSTANTLDVARNVKRASESIRENLPPSVELFESFDSSVFIEEAINEVYQTLIIAMALVVIVLYLFLGSVRTVLIPAVTVPVCIIASFTVLAAFGLTINLLTLLALVLAIGLVVDDAIVVLENIYRRIEEGEPRLLAAYRGARQVGFAVIATTLVLIGVFVPIAFLEGDIGRLFGELAITMSTAVAFSSLVALTLSPMMCSKLLRRKEGAKPLISRLIDRQYARLAAGYRAALEGCLANKALVMLIVLACFALIWGLLRTIPTELVPQEDRGAFFISGRGPEGAGFAFLADRMEKVEAIALDYVGEGGVSRAIIRAEEGNSAFGVIIMAPWRERDRSTQEIISAIRQRTAQIPGIQVGLFMRGGIGGGRSGDPVQFVIPGDSYEQLGEYRDIIQSAVAENPNLVSVDFDYRETQPQLRLQIDRNRAADLGVSVANIGTTLETALGGRQVTTFIEDGEEYDVIVRLDDRDRRSPSDIANIYVRSERSEELIPLSSLVTIAERAGASTLNRYNRRRALTLSANLAEGYSLGAALEYLEQTTREQLPEVNNVDYKGESLEFKEAGGAIYFTFVMALLVVFLILAGQFESFIHPFVIMLTVPIAVAGGLIGLKVTGGTVNIYSQIGVIMLIGLSAKNGILIVEFANQLRDTGLAVREALLEATAIRLRPIIMTSLSTVMGSVPLIIATGPGSASRVTIGVVIFAGVLVATVFTIFVVPVFYDMLARFTRSPGYEAARLRRQQADHGEPEADPAE